MAGVTVFTTALSGAYAAAQLHVRRASSSSATCSYTVSPGRRRHEGATVTCKAAQTEVAESPEAPEELSDDIIGLLGPRTVPTPLLSPQEVRSISMYG